MFRMIPDLDLLDQTLAAQQEDWIVLTLRGIGEMIGDCNANKQAGQVPSWLDLSDQTDEFGVRRAWVNLVASQDDNTLWDTMDKAALGLANALANNDATKIKVIAQTRDGRKVSPHLRRAHWHGFWTGSKADPNFKYKWLSLMVIAANKEQGERI